MFCRFHDLCVNSKPDFVLICKLAEQYYVHNLYKTRRSTKNQLSDFGLIEEIMNLSRILSAE